MNQREKLIQRTMDVQREITQAGLKRRDLLKMGLLSATTGLLLPISGLSLRAAYASAQRRRLPGSRQGHHQPAHPALGGRAAAPGRKADASGTTILPTSIAATAAAPPARIPIGTLTGGDSKIRCCSDFPELHTCTPYRGSRPPGLGQARNPGQPRAAEDGTKCAPSSSTMSGTVTCLPARPGSRPGASTASFPVRCSARATASRISCASTTICRRRTWASGSTRSRPTCTTCTRLRRATATRCTPTIRGITTTTTTRTSMPA